MSQNGKFKWGKIQTNCHEGQAKVLQEQYEILMICRRRLTEISSQQQIVYHCPIKISNKLLAFSYYQPATVKSPSCSPSFNSLHHAENNHLEEFQYVYCTHRIGHWAIAAQSIAESITQLTLNTFHLPGLSDKKCHSRTTPPQRTFRHNQSDFKILLNLVLQEESTSKRSIKIECLDKLANIL